MSSRGDLIFADDLLSLDALIFLFACLLSYWALRTRNTCRWHRVESIADILFIIGLVLMVIVCALIVYEIE